MKQLCAMNSNTSHFPFATKVLVVFKKGEFFLCLLHRKGRSTSADIQASMHTILFLFDFLFDFLFVLLPPLMVVEWMHTPYWLAPIISFFLFFLFWQLLFGSIALPLYLLS